MRSIVLVCLLFAPGLLQTINVRENSNLVITAETSSDPENDEAVQLIINFPAGTKLSGLTGRAVEVYTNKVVVNAPQSTQLNIAAGQASEVIPCDDGWANFEKTSSCYKLIPDRSEVFHAAEQVCKSNGAHLVSINSMEEFKFVRGIVDYEFGAGVPAWIGLHTNLLTCELEWTDGTAETNVTGLNTCYPNPLFCNLEMCVVSAPQPNHFYCTGSHFAGVSCTENKPVICKKPQYGDVDECQDNNGGCSQMCVNLPKLYECQCQEGFLLASDGKTCEEGEQRCEDGWIYYEESNTCFKAFHTPLSYYVAESACQEEDAHLASVHSREEAEFIQILNEHPCTLAWIGLALNETTITWMWTDGSPYDFKWWQEAENNNIDTEKWMTMYYGSECVTNPIPKPAYWNNIVLTGNFLPFICKKAILDR